jgi:hypothetical protein
MSAQSPAAVQTGPDAAARHRSATSLYVALGLFLIVLTLIMSGLLVRLDNDHNLHAVLPGVVTAGGVASGDLSLTNTGLLPIEVTLQPKLADGSTPASFPANLTISIQAVSRGATVYNGPLLASMGPLLELLPGESARLHIEVRSSGSSTAGTVPLPYAYDWNARPALPWWWWIVVIGVVAMVAAGGYWRPRRGRAAA